MQCDQSLEYGHSPCDSVGFGIGRPRRVPTGHRGDVAHSRSQIFQPAPPSALRRAGVTGNHASNRFFSFATDSDDDQIIVERSCSDTDSVPTRPRRRLRLRWNSDDAQQVPVTQIDTPDSSDQRLARVRHAVQQERVVSHVRRDVRGAAQVVRSLADRVGRVCEGQDIPRAIRRQQWSAFNVPIVWAPSAGDQECAVLQWLMNAGQHIESMSVAGTTMSGHDAALVGWETLSEVMRAWNIRTREDLSEWIHRQGFSRPRWGAHFSGRVEERIPTMAATVDARVSELEAVYVQVAFLAFRQVPLPVEPILHEAVWRNLGQRPAFPESFPEECWSI